MNKDLGIRDGIVELVELFITSTIFGDCNIVLFQTNIVLLHPFIERIGI